MRLARAVALAALVAAVTTGCKDDALTAPIDAKTEPDAAECRGPGRYQSGKEGSYRPCCAGLTEVFYTSPAYEGPEQIPVCTTPPLRVYACVRGTCGDGICEEGEAPACGCLPDCPSARWAAPDASGN
jgi:hypothetical protein